MEPITVMRYECWEFESEDLPDMINDGLKYGVIKETDNEQ